MIRPIKYRIWRTVRTFPGLDSAPHSGHYAQRTARLHCRTLNRLRKDPTLELFTVRKAS